MALQEVTNEPLVLRNSIRIPARNCAVVPAYCAQMFSGKVMAILGSEVKHRFPNIYVTGHGLSASAHGLWDLGELHSSTERDSSFPHSTPGAVPLILMCI